MKNTRWLAAVSITLSALTLAAAPARGGAQESGAPSGGELRIVPAADGARCPLVHTDVDAEITGSVALVHVSQVFRNPFDHAIEAVYVFPLSNRGAVDDMEIRVADRSVIRAEIKKREEARAAYDAARAAGHTAALLDQERPNVFTQSVANIPPDAEVVVRIRYFETLAYTANHYEFAFPMVVMPRYVPNTPSAVPETDDPSRINPPFLPPGGGAGLPAETRPGRDIALEVRFDTGVRARDIESPTHRVIVTSDGHGGDIARLAPEDSIPNRDFVLRYTTDEAVPTLTTYAHRTEETGYVMALVQPSLAPDSDDLTPKELVFLVDDSGSMSGPPIEQVKEAMRYALDNLHPLDTFRIIAFSDRTRVFEPGALVAAPGDIERAKRFIERFSGNGGTIMLDGVQHVLDEPSDPGRLRIVCFMTDGGISNEAEVVSYIGAHLGASRVFPLGVGSAPNRHLIDSLASAGRGVADFISPGEDATAAIRRFYDRIRSPLLTNLEIDWGGLEVRDVEPRLVPDLFVGQPVVLYGRYDAPGRGEVTLHGRLGGKPWETRLVVELPDRQDDGQAIGTLWARARITALTDATVGLPDAARIEKIVELALAHRLMTAYTSFVAVEDRVNVGPGEPERIEVPSCLPQGMSYEKVFGTPGAEMMERVRVTASADVVNTESTSTTTTISSEFIDSLPILGRNYQDVLTLVDGVSVHAGAGFLNAHGARDTDVVTLGSAEPPRGDQELTLDSIQEIEVVTSGASAEFSRGQGGFASHAVVSHITMSRDKLHAGETVVVMLTIENLGSTTVSIPSLLTVAHGTARFAVTRDEPRRYPIVRHPQDDVALFTASVPERSLAPGERLAVGIVLNAPGGYDLSRAGRYRLVFLGSEYGIEDSNTLTLTIKP
jgi:Ca-activated chloride channel family protein